ncbi:MAG: acetyl-CoA C-acetyltransferase [Gammaproteobacteria bacterium]|nr:acetyl-CoA C-acetyltransferase [Gammaproteobacteria bacterium]
MSKVNYSFQDDAGAKSSSRKLARPVYIIDGARTPFLKAGKEPGPFSASDLAVYASRELLTRQPFAPTAIDEVVLGCMMPSEREANIGRIVGLRLGCGDDVPGWTVQRNCASGMQSLDSALKDIACGRHDLVLAGGTEAMSRAPLLLRPSMVRWLSGFWRAKTFGAKVSALTQLKLAYLKPIIALLCGLTDPLNGLNMGETAEILASHFDISRREMDEFALKSHRRLIDAQDGGWLKEIVPVYANDGSCFEHDTGVRRDSTLEKLTSLGPFFDKYGKVTAGNSSQITDGASMLLLASEAAVKKYQLKPQAQITDVEWAALDPRVMGLGPVMAATPLMQRHHLNFSDVDYWEINEAFAAQVLACLKAWEDPEFCRTHLHLEDAFGSLDRSRLNIDGGAIATGHPVGASGARIAYHLATVLQRKKANRGIAAICIGGGQGGAMLIET